MSDLFSRKSTSAPTEDDDDDAFVVDTSEPASEPEVATTQSVENKLDILDYIEISSTEPVKIALAVADVGLSVASSVAGFTLGAVNAGAGLVKNLSDYVGSGLSLLGTAPLKDQFPDAYEEASRVSIHDTTVIPQDMMDDYNGIAEIVQYEPKTTYGERFVVNLNEKLEGARRWVGDRAAGIPTVDKGSEVFEVDSLAELESLRTLDNSPTGVLRKIAGAAGQSSIDIALMVAGGLLTKGLGRGVTGAKAPTVVEGLSESTMTLEALNALDNSKPRFASIEEANVRIQELASGKARQQITVETIQGLPVKVIGGQDAILTLKEMKRTGTPVREAKVNFVERDIISNETPVPEGFIRFYHGGAKTSGGTRWVSQDKTYAEGYANKGSGAEVQYVDLDPNGPILSKVNKSFDDTGTSMKAPYVHFEVPSSMLRSMAKPASIDAAAIGRANKAFATDDAAAAALEQASKKSLKDRTVRGAVDSSGNVKRELLASSGELGRKAVRDLELTAGATPRAILVSNDAWHRVFKNLSNSDGTGAVVNGMKVATERELFNRFVRANRIIAIEKSKLGTSKKVNFEAGTSGHDMAQWLQSLKGEVGPEKFAELSVRTKALFDTSRGQLDKMLNEGLVSPIEHAKMKNIDYLRTEFVDKLDPLTEQKIGGKVIQVGESGIQPIGRGAKGGVLLDAEGLMNEMIVRTENRISRNRANKRLYDIATADPKNTVVKLAKVTKGGELADAPPGFDTIKVMVNGKLQGVHMPEWLAQEWKMSDPAVSATTANVMRIMSGSAIVRPLATGYNPGFILTNIPRDIVHAWLATNNVYSAALPKYLMQLGQDMITVAKDSVTKSGRYEDYIHEGGGLSFLTHQGRDVIAKSAGQMAVEHKPAMKLVRDSLSYLNEQSEIMVRLAIRERVLRNQRESGMPIDPIEATWVARRYLDFAQGGSVVKAFDNIIPYLNATTQAYRTVARAAKEKPGEFAAKATQIAGVYASLETYNMLFNQEAHEQIPEKQRRSSLIFHTGNFIIDEEGNKRFEYYSVKKDQSTIAATVWLEQLVDFYVTGKPPTDSTFSYLMESLPGLSNNVPILSAAHTYLSDYNFWYGKDIFGRDLNIADFAKFKGLPGEPTDQAFKDFGEIFNLKPEALQQAVNQVIPNNTYMQMAGKSYEMMFADADPRELARTTEERMARMPFVNRIYKLTHPAATALDNMDRIAEPVNTEEFLRTQKLKDILYQSTRTGDYKEARAYAESFANTDVFVYKKMMNRVIGTQRLDQIFDKRKANFEDLPKSWWLGMMALPSKARAEVYFEEWSGESADRKRFMDSTAAALSSGDLNFIDNEYMYHLTNLKNSRNSKSMHDGDE